jgi:undecaprenyl diphosphate synthase
MLGHHFIEALSFVDCSGSAHSVGIVMDGNRRYAKMARLENNLRGHEHGQRALEEVLVLLSKH